jgi:hypothetical protein
MQLFVLGLQLLSGFPPFRMQGNAFDWTNLLALRLGKMADALGALMGIDLIELLPHENGIIRAFRLAYITIDAFIRDHERHFFS